MIEKEIFDTCRFNRLNAMAQQILAKDPNNKEVLDKLRQLKAEQDLMDDLWAKKNKELQAAKEHQVTFNTCLYN